MSAKPSDNNVMDEYVRDVLCQPVPAAVEHQLRDRVEKVWRHVSERKPHLLTRRQFGWLALASAGGAAAVAVPLWHSGAQPAWADLVNDAKEHPWMHFAGRHPNGTRLQFWVSLRKGIHAMKAGNAEFAHFQSKESRTRQWYRASEGVVYQEPYRRAPGELGYLERLLDRFSRGASSVEVPGPDEIIAQSRCRVVQEGREFWKYEFTLKAFDEGHADTYVVVFLVDPKTRLPRKWARKSPDGSRELSFDIDYPLEGPEDVFSLGVPKTAQQVKRNR